MKILLTGAAGFVGYHCALAFLSQGHETLGIDNLNDYYDPSLKQARLKQLEGRPGFRFEQIDVADAAALNAQFQAFRPQRVLHLAAQAGVRYSLQNPQAYTQSNLVGFANLLECCRHNPVEHLVYASSSSVYGANTKVPFSVQDMVEHPVSLYAATKKANELMAHAYSDLYRIPTTGLRFFTVYGPWGRPDMAYFSFTKAILEGKPIEVFNHGDMERDFTYIDDIVDGVSRVLAKIPEPDPNWGTPAAAPGRSRAPYRVYNIGNDQPVRLGDFIDTLERQLGKKAFKINKPMAPGDVHRTHADISDLKNDTGFSPATPIETGLRKFTEWYKSYYRG